MTVCQSCGATNPPDADWCNLCFARFAEAPEPEAAPEPEPVPAPEPAAWAAGDSARPGDQLSLLEDDRKTWQCRFCDTQVPIEATLCPACQQSIYDSFGSGQDRPAVDEGAVRRWAAVPGGGHVKAGQGVLGAAIGLMVAISLGFGVVLLASGRSAHGAALAFIGTATWAISALDGYRISRNEPDGVLLRPRVISVLSAVMFMVIVAAALSSQPAINQ